MGDATVKIKKVNFANCQQKDTFRKNSDSERQSEKERKREREKERDGGREKKIYIKRGRENVT